MTPREAEQALSGKTVELDFYEMDGEARYEVIGSTENGRILKVVTTDRAGLIRVVTAHDVPKALKNLYSMEK